jgi:hypothetical protein
MYIAKNSTIKQQIKNKPRVDYILYRGQVVAIYRTI